MKTTIVPTAVVCEWLGITAQAVSDLAKRGIIPKAGRDKWALQAVVTAYTAHMREVAAGRKADTDQALDLVQERAQLARAQREYQDMRNAEKAGQLLPRAVVDQAVVDAFTRVRTKLLRIPAKAAARPGEMQSATLIRSTLEAMVLDALGELADVKVDQVPANDAEDD